MAPLMACDIPISWSVHPNPPSVYIGITQVEMVQNREMMGLVLDLQISYSRRPMFLSVSSLTEMWCSSGPERVDLIEANEGEREDAVYQQR